MSTNSAKGSTANSNEYLKSKVPCSAISHKRQQKGKEKEGIHPVFEVICQTLGLVCFSYEDFYPKTHTKRAS